MTFATSTDLTRRQTAISPTFPRCFAVVEMGLGTGCCCTRRVNPGTGFGWTSQPGVGVAVPRVLPAEAPAHRPSPGPEAL
jgi:hypothetical protein